MGVGLPLSKMLIVIYNPDLHPRNKHLAYIVVLTSVDVPHHKLYTAKYIYSNIYPWAVTARRIFAYS